MMDDHEIDQRIAPWIAAARRTDAGLPAGLAARILTDAARVQSDRRNAGRQPAAEPVWRQVLALLGGVPALGGLAAACATGIWLGAAPPQGLDPLALVAGGLPDLTVFASIYLPDALFVEEGL